MAEKSLPSLEALMASLKSAEEKLSKIIVKVPESPELDSVATQLGSLCMDIIEANKSAKDHLAQYQQEQIEKRETYSAIEDLLNKSKSSKREEKMTDRLKKLVIDATEDKLSGLYNRRSFDEKLEELITLQTGPHRRSDDHTSFGLALIDIDYFKKINDKCGHAGGDRVINSLGMLLQKNIRESAYRYGGEEFAVILPFNHESPYQVEKIMYGRMESIRKLVESTLTIQDCGPVTISVGIAAYKHDLTGTDLIERADGALYSSKRNGRNRVTCTLYEPEKSGPIPIPVDEEKSAPYLHIHKNPKK